jgi:hypothetical protein
VNVFTDKDSTWVEVGVEGIWPDLDTVDLLPPDAVEVPYHGRLKIRSEGEASNMAYVMPKDAKLFSYCGGLFVVPWNPETSIRQDIHSRPLKVKPWFCSGWKRLIKAKWPPEAA